MAEKVKGEGKAFYSPEEVIIAYNEDRLICMLTLKCKNKCT